MLLWSMQCPLQFDPHPGGGSVAPRRNVKAAQTVPLIVSKFVHMREQSSAESAYIAFVPPNAFVPVYVSPQVVLSCWNHIPQ
jgi:hypothetical protein